MRSLLRWSMAASVLLVAASAGAQDHVNVTIIAPTIGSIPQLVAGSFEITNEGQIVTHQIRPGAPSDVVGVGTTEPVKVSMTLPWGGEAAQLLRALVSGVIPSAIDSVRCDFVHAGSNQPYYTVVIDHPIISRVHLEYDSATAAATEELALAAPQVEYRDGGASGTAAATPATPTLVRSRVALARSTKPAPHLRLVASPSTLRRLMAPATGVAGPPVAGFASFAAASAGSAQFAPEASFPSWTNGAMTSIQTLSVTAERPLIIVLVTGQDGATSAVPHVGAGFDSLQATFSKPVGSLSNDLQSAAASHQWVTTTLQLADAPGRLAYRLVFQGGKILSDHTSLQNGRATEQVTVVPLTGLVVTDLRRNIAATVR